MLKLYNDDCMNILRSMEDDTVDLIITSPPYNLGYFNYKDPTKRVLVEYNSYEDNLSYDDYIEWQRVVLDECYRVLKPTGVMYYNHKERHKKGFYFNPLQILFKTEFNILQTIIWQRNRAINFNTGRFTNCYETIIVMYKSDEYMKIGSRYEKYLDVWDISPDNNPCQIASFPVELVDRIIQAYDYKNDLLVLDPFMGSGTTGLCSLMNNRDFIGVEIDEKYFNCAKKRLSNYQSKLI